MDKTTRIIMCCLFAPGTLWDVITTFSGVSQIVHGGLYSIVLTIFINGILALSFAKFDKEGLMEIIWTGMWIGALLGDLVTSFVGNWGVSSIQSPDPLQYFLIGLSALFTTGSTIGLSNALFAETK